MVVSLQGGERRSLRTKRTLPTGDLDHRTDLVISTGFSTANLLTVGDRHGKLLERSQKNPPVSTGVQQGAWKGRPISAQPVPSFQQKHHPSSLEESTLNKGVASAMH